MKRRERWMSDYRWDRMGMSRLWIKRFKLAPGRLWRKNRWWIRRAFLWGREREMDKKVVTVGSVNLDAIAGWRAAWESRSGRIEGGVVGLCGPGRRW
jgi:hypothetical protein